MPIADSPQTCTRPAGLTVRRGSYAAILAVGSAARVFGLVSQFVVLIMLGRILSKDGLGDLMTAFGFYRLISSALGIGGSLVLLYHVSRRPSDHDAEIRLHRCSALLGAAASALVALTGYLLAGSVGAGLGKPGLVLWLRELAPFTIFSTLLVISTGALEGRSRISESITIAEVVPNAIRIVLLPAITWLAAWVHRGSIGFSLVKHPGNPDLDPGIARALDSNRQQRSPRAGFHILANSSCDRGCRNLPEARHAW
jgi:hypothetical protein